MSKSREHVDALTGVLVKHGINDWRIDDQGKHFRLVFKHKGKEQFYVFPRSASDHRAVKNGMSDLRKMIAPPRKPRSVTAKPKAKRAQPTKAKQPLPDLPKVTVKPDPWAKLAQVKFQPKPWWRRIWQFIIERGRKPA